MRAQEKANDLGFPNGQGEQVELLQGLELRALDQASQHGEEDPLLLVFGFTPHPGPLLLYSSHFSESKAAAC